ncbi:2-oxo-4-hydroxy-4-carboxy-5-ureidoimidazoline decarboxylase, partial [Streptomyces palmae]
IPAPGRTTLLTGVPQAASATARPACFPQPPSAASTAPRPLPGLTRFNAASPAAAEAALLSCCGSRSWARRIATHRPYPDLESLLAAGDEASYDLTATDLAEALAGESAGRSPLTWVRRHPPSGARSRLAAHTALTAAHAEYQRRFGHVFLIYLDEVGPDEVLDAVLVGIRTRLGHEKETESAVAADELRRIARGRLARLATSPSRQPEITQFHLA